MSSAPAHEGKLLIAYVLRSGENATLSSVLLHRVMGATGSGKSSVCVRPANHRSTLIVYSPSSLALLLANT